jgi:hypothetical protein
MARPSLRMADIRLSADVCEPVAGLPNDLIDLARELSLSFYARDVLRRRGSAKVSQWQQEYGPKDMAASPTRRRRARQRPPLVIERLETGTAEDIIDRLEPPKSEYCFEECSFRGARRHFVA